MINSGAPRLITWSGVPTVSATERSLALKAIRRYCGDDEKHVAEILGLA